LDNNIHVYVHIWFMMENYMENPFLSRLKNEQNNLKFKTISNKRCA
jgi:hypothetical protein